MVYPYMMPRMMMPPPRPMWPTMPQQPQFRPPVGSLPPWGWGPAPISQRPYTQQPMQPMPTAQQPSTVSGGYPAGLTPGMVLDSSALKDLNINFSPDVTQSQTTRMALRGNGINNITSFNATFKVV